MLTNSFTLVYLFPFIHSHTYSHSYQHTHIHAYSFTHIHTHIRLLTAQLEAKKKEHEEVVQRMKLEEQRLQEDLRVSRERGAKDQEQMVYLDDCLTQLKELLREREQTQKTNEDAQQRVHLLLQEENMSLRTQVLLKSKDVEDVMLHLQDTTNQLNEVNEVLNQKAADEGMLQDMIMQNANLMQQLESSFKHREEALSSQVNELEAKLAAAAQESTIALEAQESAEMTQLEQLEKRLLERDQNVQSLENRLMEMQQQTLKLNQFLIEKDKEIEQLKEQLKTAKTNSLPPIANKPLIVKKADPVGITTPRKFDSPRQPEIADPTEFRNVLKKVGSNLPTIAAAPLAKGEEKKTEAQQIDFRSVLKKSPAPQQQ